MVRKEELEKKGMQLRKYELGRTLGKGNFGKVKLARNVETGHYVVVKIIEKNKVIALKITDQVCLSFPCLINGFFKFSIVFSFDKWVPFREQNEYDSDLGFGFLFLKTMDFRIQALTFINVYGRSLF
jgi:serine/threonine protein kinase